MEKVHKNKTDWTGIFNDEKENQRREGKHFVVTMFKYSALMAGNHIL